MAPPKCMLAAVLLTFALLAFTLQPSEAIRVKASEKKTTTNADNGGWPWPGFPNIPGLPPLVPPFPPIPSLPPLPPIPFLPNPPSPGSGTPPPPPTGGDWRRIPDECLPSLSGLLQSCMDYLTNATVPAPPSTCCDGFKALAKDTPSCVCHAMNGDLNFLLPVPIDYVRMLFLPATCKATLPLRSLDNCSMQKPLKPPPHAAAPSPVPAT